MRELINGIDTSIVDEKASHVGPSGIDIAYQRLGSRDTPPVLLIMGITAQSVAWPDSFCHALVHHGLQIIRFGRSHRPATPLGRSCFSDARPG